MAAQGLTILEGERAPAMAERTTLRLGGPVMGEAVLTEPAAAALLPGIAKRLGGRLACLGAGSNILAGEGPLDLVLVKNGMAPDISVLGDDGKTATLRASGSARLPVLLGRAAALDLGGLEGLSGIPGSVGGAVAMNAGSYGQCIADSLTALEIVTGEGEVRRFGREAVAFGYRAMDLPEVKGWWMVTAAEFRLTREEAGAVREKSRELLDKKRATQPVTAASAGCVFKNPSPEQPAGKLLDAAGFKGKRLGGMIFSPLHANFLVNEGRGTSTEALELMDMAKQAVFAASGIILEPEVRIWV
ncbi:UDP-N-acetylenolpyruvoylglucosamine reductase [uncultured delta proteobacterium]|uniref:UDP-N-acetylenolpyruvoylglucosamine reductase n=1 Tax=uncultured delta proteobacterium TaxID=34034 RepID=A0A212JHH3_9DELT|nr:UDP-N-acetylenolpyruvoylglucosamine reductase [uncultured delta proteobacterium]